MPMRVTTLRLTDRLWTLLDAQARVEGTSASELIREGAMMRLGYALGKRGGGEKALATPLRSEPFADFAAAADEVLAFLHDRLGFSCWIVARVEAEQWVVEQARDEGCGVKAGDAFSFADTFCSRMVAGDGPQFAPKASDVPCYAAAAIGKELSIGSYLGVPLFRSDGSLFGTLCAIDPAPHPPNVGDELPLVQMGGRILSSLLEEDAEERRN